MRFGPGDVPVDIGVIPREASVERSDEGQSVLVVTTKGYGKRVRTNEFRLTRRWDLFRVSSPFATRV